MLLKILLHVVQCFFLLNHREAGAKASCTETKASPSKTSTFVFLRQRQVKLLSEPFHPNTLINFRSEF